MSAEARICRLVLERRPGAEVGWGFAAGVGRRDPGWAPDRGPRRLRPVVRTGADRPGSPRSH
ncbi:hypothetical protein CcI49_03645 [Frankia sp. CcI49]|nr:hypothetical protein CcI49_03645 [Frankia sp. CcI49]